MSSSEQFITTRDVIRDPELLNQLRDYASRGSEFKLSDGLGKVLDADGSAITAKDLAFLQENRALAGQIFDAQRRRSCVTPNNGDDLLNVPINTVPGIRETFGKPLLHITCLRDCVFGIAGVVTRGDAKTRCNRALGNTVDILNATDTETPQHYPVTVKPRTSDQISYWMENQVSIAGHLGIKPQDIFNYAWLEDDKTLASFVSSLEQVLTRLDTRKIAGLSISDKAQGVLYSHLLCNFRFENGPDLNLMAALPSGYKGTDTANMLLQDYQALRAAANGLENTRFLVSNQVGIAKPIGLQYLTVNNNGYDYPFYVSSQIKGHQIGVVIIKGVPSMVGIPTDNGDKPYNLGSDFSGILRTEALIYLASNKLIPIAPSLSAGDWMVDLEGRDPKLFLMTFRGGAKPCSENEWISRMTNLEESAKNQESKYISYYPYRDYTSMTPRAALENAKALLGIK